MSAVDWRGARGRTADLAWVRRIASALPAVLIGYSALIDPLLNLNPVVEVDVGGYALEGEPKSTILTKLVIPGLCALAITLWTAARSARPMVAPGVVMAPLAAFFLLALASAAWALDPAPSLTLTIYQILLCTTLALAVAVSGDPGMILKHLFVLFLVVIGVNVLTAVVRPPGPIGHQGIYPYKNTLGSAAACGFLFTCFFVVKGGWPTRVAAVLGSAGAIFLLVISESKTALALAVFAPVLAIALYGASRLAAVNIFAFLIGGTVFAAALVVVAAQFWRFDSGDVLTLLFGDETFTGRTDVWNFAAGHITERPWLGHGYRSFWSIGPDSPKYSAEIEFVRTIGSSHSGFFDVLIDLGLAGFVLLILTIGGVFAACARSGLRPALHTIFYLAVVFYAIGRNAMESVILWSTFFDNLSFVLIGFLALQTERQARVAAFPFQAVRRPGPGPLAAA